MGRGSNVYGDGRGIAGSSEFITGPDRKHKKELEEVLQFLINKHGYGAEISNPYSIKINGKSIANSLSSLEFRGCVKIIKKNDKHILRILKNPLD